MQKIYLLGIMASCGVLYASALDKRALLEKHNELRGDVVVAPLQWSDKLAAVASAWAKKCRFEHNSRRHEMFGATVGENIAWMSHRPSPMEVAAKLWGEELDNWACQANRCEKGMCGHYTQMVWEGSLQVGCGVASCGGSDYVVCNYYPAGNYVGKRPFASKHCR